MKEGERERDMERGKSGKGGNAKEDEGEKVFQKGVEVRERERRGGDGRREGKGEER